MHTLVISTNRKDLSLVVVVHALTDEYQMISNRILEVDSERPFVVLIIIIGMCLPYL